MSIGQRIIDLRQISGMSQNQLAKEMEISRQAVSKWENDLSIPDSMNMIRLAEILDTDLEYLTTGRKTLSRRPPIVINTVETVETVVEKPVVQVVETVVEKIVEKPVIKYIEKPVVKKIYRKEFLRNPLEFAVCGGICLLIGFLIGLLF